MSGTVYRLFAADDTLLYIGASMTAATRLGAHADKGWWGEVQRATFEHHPTREAAFEAEGVAIATERPRYNVARTRRVMSDAERQRRKLERERKFEERMAAQQAELRELRDRCYQVHGRCGNCGRREPWVVKGTQTCDRCGCDVREEIAA